MEEDSDGSAESVDHRSSLLFFSRHALTCRIGTAQAVSEHLPLTTKWLCPSLAS